MYVNKVEYFGVFLRFAVNTREFLFAEMHPEIANEEPICHG